MKAQVPAPTIVNVVPLVPVVVQTLGVVEAKVTVAPLVLNALAVKGSSPNATSAQLPSGQSATSITETPAVISNDCCTGVAAP